MNWVLQVIIQTNLHLPGILCASKQEMFHGLHQKHLYGMRRALIYQVVKKHWRNLFILLKVPATVHGAVQQNIPKVVLNYILKNGMSSLIHQQRTLQAALVAWNIPALYSVHGSQKPADYGV